MGLALPESIPRCRGRQSCSCIKACEALFWRFGSCLSPGLSFHFKRTWHRRAMLSALYLLRWHLDAGDRAAKRAFKPRTLRLWELSNFRLAEYCTARCATVMRFNKIASPRIRTPWRCSSSQRRDVAARACHYSGQMPSEFGSLLKPPPSASAAFLLNAGLLLPGET